MIGVFTIFDNEIEKSLIRLYQEEKITLEVFRYYGRLINLVRNAQLQGETHIDLREIGITLTN
jgi:hypothetical protein